MKQIQPIQIWANGHPTEATKLNLKIVSDNLNNSAVIYYELLSKNNNAIYENEYNKLSEGNLTIEGEEYLNWNGGNNEIYTLCATKLNLTLI